MDVYPFDVRKSTTIKKNCLSSFSRWGGIDKAGGSAALEKGHPVLGAARNPQE
jgi:hypothetical protein